MSPKNFTHELLIGWGGEKVFAHGLRLGNGGSVVKAEWDPATHKATGEILLSDRREQRTGFTLFDDGNITWHSSAINTMRGIFFVGFFVLYSTIFDTPLARSNFPRSRILLLMSRRISNVI